MNRNSGKKESCGENSESKHDWNIPRVAAIFEDGDKIRLSSKNGAFAAKNGWNGTRLEFVTEPIERRCVMGKKSA